MHLHLDTGMARDGADPASWAALCRAARRAEQRGEVEVVGVMGHLGCADDPRRRVQRARAGPGSPGRSRPPAACGLRPRDRHLAATAATLTDPRTHHTMSRVGAGLVGIDPSGTTRLHAGDDADRAGRPGAAGAAPGRRSATATRTGPRAATHLGLVPLGYADGLPRLASGRAEVLVRGVRRPVVGRISMDQLVVDLGSRGVDPGETVTVFGPGAHGEPTVADWAALGRTRSSTRSSPASAPASSAAPVAAPHLRSLS